MNFDKQLLLLSYLLSDQTLFIKVNPILKYTYFDTRIRNTIQFISKYFEEYKIPPTAEQVKAETGQDIEIKTSLTKQEINYAENEIETFCKNKAIEHAILTSAKLLNDDKTGEIEKLIKDALTVSLQRNVGLNYFDDPEQRLKLLSLRNNCIPTNFIKLDEYLGGGINRQEMIIFSAPPGVGKSLTMANLGRNLLIQGLHGVYITLELSEDVTAKRFDSMFTNISQVDILKNVTEVSIKVKNEKSGCGEFFIKRMPESSTNTNHIRAYLKEFEIVNGFLPDFMIIDYMDLMSSVQNVSAENTFIRDKFISEELRALAHDFNMIMITASQLNRGAQLIDNIEDLSQAHIAGGISKVNTTDNLIAIVQTQTMKAKGELMYKLLKTRSSNGVGNFYMMKLNPVSLILENLEDTSKLHNSIKINNLINKQPEEKLDINNLPFQI